LKPAPGTFPNLDAHYARMMARPAVQKTIAAEAAIGYDLPA
jgi:glutathione S-transferase